MDAEVEDTTTRNSNTASADTASADTASPSPDGDERQDWRSWFGRGIAHVAADGTDDEDAEDNVIKAKPPVRARLRRPPKKQVKDSKLNLPVTSRPLISPHLRKDPRLKVWLSRVVIALVVYLAISMWKDWRYGVTAVAIYLTVDLIYRSKTTVITPTSVRVTSAQRTTARRLKVLKAAGYLALNARTIPDSGSVIDHIVIGPGGIFTLDSQKMDKRLPVRAIDGKLFHGPNNVVEKLDHARYEAERAAALIGAELGHKVRVRPAMVVYGPKLSWVIMRLKGVDVFDGGHVGSYFRKQSKATHGKHLDTAQIAMVFSAAAHALPAINGNA
ncbi:MAG TPA: nuclease-related domain-containing protein [Streptosporangiaceae bacterium]|nr:nuclease-related domain-containing protein [Streptosporangiaceae bacterium]